MVGAALEGWRWGWKARWTGRRESVAGWKEMAVAAVGEVGEVDTARCLGAVGDDFAVGGVDGHSEVGGHGRPVGQQNL